MNQSDTSYDCVIMGAGFAGNCMARHLLLNIPGIKVALVDPRREERDDHDLKVGESCIEIGALFITQQLGLEEYMVENHVPKTGINFHWPKDPRHTNSKEDYFSIWQANHGPIQAWQFNRAKFERDVLRMNKEMGADFYHGHVVDLQLTPGDEPNTVMVRAGDSILQLRAQHVVDAAGRKFLIGKRTDNVVRDPDQLLGLRNASAWVRVRGADRSIFGDGYNPQRASASLFYSTQHWCGYGHWLWMIPSSIEDDELSIGIVYYTDKFDPRAFDKKEKLMRFLEANHNHLYRLIQSGELVDFNFRPQIAYRSKRLFSRDNWYVIGDAAYVYDALYSTGTSSIALLTESITEIIRAKRAGDRDAEDKREVFNSFHMQISAFFNSMFREVTNTLGNASVQSWRYYIEAIWWFGMMVPMYVGRWHLDKTFIKLMTPVMKDVNDGLFGRLQVELSELAQEGRNLGFVDPTRRDSLIPGFLSFTPYDHYLVNSRYEPRRVNIFESARNTSWYSIQWYLKLGWRAGGLRRVLRPASLRHLARLSAYTAGSAASSAVFRLLTRKVPANSIVDAMRREFRSYEYKAWVVPWDENSESQVTSGPAMPGATKPAMPARG